MTRVRRILRASFAVALLAGSMPLAACGGGGDDDDVGDLSGTNIRSANEDAPREKIEQTIEVKDNSFSPDTVTIKTGTTVIWKWTGTQNSHSILLQGTTSPAQTSGTFERRFDQTGNSFAYQCGVHGAAMTGRIVIE